LQTSFLTGAGFAWKGRGKKWPTAMTQAVARGPEQASITRSTEAPRSARWNAPSASAGASFRHRREILHRRCRRRTSIERGSLLCAIPNAGESNNRVYAGLAPAGPCSGSLATAWVYRPGPFLATQAIRPLVPGPPARQRPGRQPPGAVGHWRQSRCGSARESPKSLTRRCQGGEHRRVAIRQLSVSPLDGPAAGCHPSASGQTRRPG
jgi:hypothetical protein